MHTGLCIKMIWLQEKIKTLLEQVRNMVACFSLSLEKSHLVIPLHNDANLDACSFYGLIINHMKPGVSEPSNFHTPSYPLAR